MAERSARRRRLPTDVKAEIFAKQILDDFEDEVEAQFNGFIAAVVSDLTSRSVSPVLTGFFASSWKAGSTMPIEEDARKGYAPWSSIKVMEIDWPLDKKLILNSVSLFLKLLNLIALFL